MAHQTRLLFIALMLVLLPLRGWAGDIMAIDMAANRAAATAVQAKIVSMSSEATMPPDCTMHSQPSLDEAGAHCGSCDTCELCLLVANLTPAAWMGSQYTRHSSPLAFNASFTSATSALNLKPPIF